MRRAARAVREQAARAGGQATKATARATERARDLARRARDESVARVRDFRKQAQDRFSGAVVPHLCFVMSPRRPIRPVVMRDTLRIATYNVHRWQGGNGRGEPDVARAGYVISELDADVIALQEVLRPFPASSLDGAFAVRDGDDPLGLLCDELELHLAFAVTRQHRRGQLGNAILSRYPITAISVLDISYSRIERRGALAAQVGDDQTGLGVVATHLSLVDRTRHRQVQSLLEHPALNGGPAVLLGDMNAWRKCKGSQALEASLGLHHNQDWPATFPAGRPLLALDRIYTRQAEVLEVRHHDSPAARRASDHLPIVAEVRMGKREEADPEP
ncbi:MAG: endonuclease/exonuclease/phosphatase family protein [Deltaproteobacteria bacterium]|nr:endonuclease/exonuclease/phosphatase family protein [Deltaproteobacteria bacterium]